MPSIDRLSGLPDHIICHILSFLPTMNSVATNILAKRWRFLWAHLPNLDFHSRYPHTELSILDIINRFMLLYEVARMNTFRLFHVGGDCNNSQLETCITAAVARNVKNIDLCYFGCALLPGCIFTCETLVDLRLCCCGDIPTTGDVCLPALKTLHLDSVKYEFDESLVHLLSGCPVLEELMITHYPKKVMVCCDIASPTIKRLVIVSNGKYRVNVYTPALRYLKLQSCVPEDVSPGMLASLVEVDISGFHFDLIEGKTLSSVLEFVDGLCNVKCLKLSSGQFQVPDPESFTFTTMFHNLTRLELATDGYFLSYFLENADNLQVLIITKYQGQLGMEPHQETKCLSSHLRTVTIHRFGYTRNEFELIKYILWNAKVLNRMEIYSLHSGNIFYEQENSEALKRVSLFPRGSKACHLVFH